MTFPLVPTAYKRDGCLLHPHVSSPLESKEPHAQRLTDLPFLSQNFLSLCRIYTMSRTHSELHYQNFTIEIVFNRAKRKDEHLKRPTEKLALHDNSLEYGSINGFSPRRYITLDHESAPTTTESSRDRTSSFAIRKSKSDALEHRPRSQRSARPRTTTTHELFRRCLWGHATALTRIRTASTYVQILNWYIALPTPHSAEAPPRD